ncbi:MAG TPA: tandem-95 repeat protein [Ohtaekwangia sp.]|nr:tandem-95 repeat protein [Ohtaekwangia sp.]
MKSAIFVVILFVIAFEAVAQGNKKPKIVGQDELRTNEDQSITILMSHLDVEDDDDWFYPWGFTMKLYPGSNYSLEGTVVTPGANFSGTLTVQVTVHDGQDDSNKYDLKITVDPINDRPVITGHHAVSTNENQAVSIQPDHLKVDDPDNAYPADFTLRVHDGSNYSVNGDQVVPAENFVGTMSVAVSVSDGQAESEVYDLPVEVKILNRVPEITGQVSLQVNEDESITIQPSHLTVVDHDSNYPEGFSITVSSGPHYTFSNTTITPEANYFGRITIPVTVSDGKNTSKPFNLTVSVSPVNDLPVIIGMESAPIFFGSGDASVAITQTADVQDVDGDSIMFVEIGIRAEGYQAGTDKLVYSPPASSKIRGVFDSKSGILTLLGQASPASYASALKSVRYQGLATFPGDEKILFFLANDGKTDSETVERRLMFGQASVSLDIPSGFTPNGDLSNDTWKIVPLETEQEFSGVRVRVYNKAGILIYETVGFENEWDGRLNGDLLPADTYFYTIDLNTQTPEGYLKGVVTILR